uniref:mRNA export factor ICP27 homolog n=1 Tax=Mastomys natalensis cytomegalovirus 2 TaxID=2973540 RepID=A0A9Y1IL00_9BETA|nr:multifunctional expression regulator [Mastomys natalensis cytomegalovirus 2]WEG69203.1 multifunctional expression regulator [Mastomys natalensis cytomegalovirus 2]WEG69342.1 multifunctional expression regulator [Mastomys natalensis cytomegalovirus 2]WEG69480.1 multifunctional expression regulator [Mastomys natalensis cytomegalovirus 2]WEG69618.1 multifunctional expression regulator [Mastomys natalensis cytomegalovirus 2]
MQRTSVKRRLGTLPGPADDEISGTRRSKHYHGTQVHHQTWKRCSPSSPPSPPPPPPPPFDKNLATLTHLNRKLDELGPADLECLKAMIRVRQTRRNDHHAEVASDIGNIQPPTFDIRGYTTTALGLCKYPADLPDPRKQIEKRYTDKDTQIVVTHDELMNTDYILLLRRHFDTLTATDTRILVQDRVFSINNAPSADVVMAFADEALSYIKYHRVHNLPVNPDDPFMSTTGLLRYAVFNRLNLAELSCILDGEGHRDREYQILRYLANKPATQPRSGPTPFEIHRRSPSSFKHPIQRAMATIASFAKTVGAIRRRAMHERGPFFIRDFDEAGVADTYRCGMISEQIFDGLQSHRCQNPICRIKLKKLLQPYRASMFFCPLNNTRRQQDGTFRREPYRRRRIPDISPTTPKLAYPSSPPNVDNSHERERRHREHRRTKHSHHYRESRHRTAYRSVVSQAIRTDARLTSAVTSTTTNASDQDRKTHQDTETASHAPTDTTPKCDQEQHLPEETDHTCPQDSDESGSEIDTDDGSEAPNAQGEGFQTPNGDIAYTVDELATRDEEARSTDTDDIGEEPLDPDNEAVWTASVIPITLPSQIRIHRDVEDGDSDIDIPDYVEPEQEDDDIRERTDSPFDAIMECDLSYSEMDSD